MCELEAGIRKALVKILCISALFGRAIVSSLGKQASNYVISCCQLIYLFIESTWLTQQHAFYQLNVFLHIQK